MEAALAENIELDYFEQIIVNFNHEDISITHNEEQKSESFTIEEDRYIDDSNSSKTERNPEIYRIKDATKGKTELKIIDLIRFELDIKEDEVTVWNKMVKAVSHICIGNCIQFKIKTFIWFLKCVVIFGVFLNWLHRWTRWWDNTSTSCYPISEKKEKESNVIHWRDAPNLQTNRGWCSDQGYKGNLTNKSINN